MTIGTEQLIDDVCQEIRTQFRQAEHFKRLWMQTNDELEKVGQERAIMVADNVRLNNENAKLQKAAQELERTNVTELRDLLSDIGAWFKGTQMSNGQFRQTQLNLAETGRMLGMIAKVLEPEQNAIK